MHGVKLFTGAAVSVLLLALAGPMPALAETMEGALVRAYQDNPQLNAQRAQVRVTDENVPQALSGYRPRVSLTASAGYQYQDILSAPGTGPINGTTVPAAPPLPFSSLCTTATKPPTGFGAQSIRSPARARGCAISSKVFCSWRRRRTWIICAIRRRSMSTRATSASSSRR